MNSLAAILTPRLRDGETELQAGWRHHLAMVAGCWLVLLAFFWRDAWSMATIWWDVSTYNHCLLIPPIIFWLVQQRREQLVQMTPRIWMPGLLWLGLGSFGWMLGDAAGVTLARHLGLVMMLQAAIVIILGKQVTRGLAFPLFYSFFLVPFGEEFVPALQTITAKMSMVLLGWFDIPAYIEGVFISTPTGYFEVAEACSGIKFLVAMVAYGALVSNLCFLSWQRRTLFMIAAVAVPILANGIRAFGTIYIAHHTTTDFATGFDHIFYGWFFFAFVLVLVMAVGWPFFDRKIDEPMLGPDLVQAQELNSSGSMDWRRMLALMALIIALPMGWSGYLAAQQSPVPERIALPAVGGWEIVDYQPRHEWRPRFDGASHELLGRYRNRQTGMEVDLAIAVFDRQTEGRELVGYGQGALDPDSKWAWSRNLSSPSGSKGEQFTAPGPVLRDVYSFYRVGNIVTGSGSAVKLETLKAKLTGGNQQAVAVLVSSEQGDEPARRAAMTGFVEALGPIDKLADEMAGLR